MKSKPAVLALCLNAVVLLLILMFVSTREQRSFGQTPPPAPAAQLGTGLTVMPAQLSPNTWGCYVMDTQNQTLSVYQFSPGEHELKFAAGRDVQYDRQMGNYNTTPSPTEIHHMLDRAAEPPRAAPATMRSPEAMPQ